MLQAINDRIKGWLGIVIVVLIGLPFALWGINSYFDDAGPRYAAKVNDTEISAVEFERTVSMQRQRMLNQYDGKLPIDDNMLRERTLTQLINQRLLETSALARGYRISDIVVAERIKQQFTVDGVFDRARFEATVASAGMSVPMYENALRNELLVQQVQAAISNSAFVTKKELDMLAELSEQTRDISVLTFDVEQFSTAAKPTQEEIKEFYEANRQNFMVPEKIKIDYVEITSQSLAENVEVDEAQIQQMYDDYVASISGREERKVRHILLQTSEDTAGNEAAKEKIKALKLEIDGGADFAELAKKHSQDSASAGEGGDLGWVALGEMAKPFEIALFAMELNDKGEGSFSDVVETQFGYHLINLEDIRSETVESIDIKRYSFEEELKTEAAASLFYDLSERLASIAYENPDNLDVVIEELELELKSSDDFTRIQGTGIATNENVRSVAFSPLVLEQGSNSDIIEINPNHVVVLRLNRHTPASAIPLADVTSKIETQLIASNGFKQANEAALDIKTKIEAGENIESFKSDAISLVTISHLGRNESSKVSSPSILYNAFEITPRPDEKPSARVVNLASNGLALVVLTGVNSPDEVDKEMLEIVKDGIVRQKATFDFSSVLTSIKSTADIDKNTRLLEK